MAKNKSNYRKFEVYTLPRLLVLKGSALVKVIPHALIITAFSILIVALWTQTNIKLGIKPDFILVINFVVSLLLAYRTNAAYTRMKNLHPGDIGSTKVPRADSSDGYWEGRQLWSTMITSIRNLLRYVWVNVPDMNKNNENNENNENDIDPEKLVVFCLLTEFAAATKEFLREESFNESSGVHLNMESSDNKEDENNESSINKILKCLQKNGPEPSPNKQPTKIKLISLYLNHYIGQLKNREVKKQPDTATIMQMYANVEKLVECLTGLESVVKSPIPLSYIIHLLQTTWLFCLSLPFQLVEDLKWVTIPVVFLSSLLLLGVEAIAREIEDPFGTDPNDLKIDYFCETIDTEKEFVKKHNNMEVLWEKAINRISDSPEISVKVLKETITEITEIPEDTEK
ncbi:14964_t:CDS:2 [Gigaspora margarita]|uniref:14964_t:CDS:1 n=1 Tax=Gigaspora margarita TaxID=4874 RepID=A0ABM8W4K2_GIGMA|nr:14964_t:CDS:2 [Gigaspora margarita]